MKTTRKPRQRHQMEYVADVLQKAGDLVQRAIEGSVDLSACRPNEVSSAVIWEAAKGMRGADRFRAIAGDEMYMQKVERDKIGLSPSLQDLRASFARATDRVRASYSR